MSEIIDDKSDHCVPFILGRIKEHQTKYHAKGQDAPPFFIGLNGVQGAGKTTLVSTLCATLRSEPNNLPTVVLSIDDLYLPHAQQQALAASHPRNPLVQHRGQPSTHDIDLGIKLFASLANRDSDISIPSYDKSAFSGQGDRRDKGQWDVVNASTSPTKVEVVLFEGWCVGFRPLSQADLEEKWKVARSVAQSDDAYTGQLGKLELESVQFVNSALGGYNLLTDKLDAFIHIDAQDTQYVYKWRLQQEKALRASKGTGMTDQQVVHFVNGYYPAYELYTDVLRTGIYHEPGRQLRLVVGEDRRVKEVHKI